MSSLTILVIRELNLEGKWPWSGSSLPSQLLSEREGAWYSQSVSGANKHKDVWMLARLKDTKSIHFVSQTSLWSRELHCKQCDTVIVLHSVVRNMSLTTGEWWMVDLDCPCVGDIQTKQRRTAGLSKGDKQVGTAPGNGSYWQWNSYDRTCISKANPEQYTITTTALTGHPWPGSWLVWGLRRGQTYKAERSRHRHVALSVWKGW